MDKYYHIDLINQTLNIDVKLCNDIYKELISVLVDLDLSDVLTVYIEGILDLDSYHVLFNILSALPKVRYFHDATQYNLNVGSLNINELKTSNLHFIWIFLVRPNILNLNV